MKASVRLLPCCIVSLIFAVLPVIKAPAAEIVDRIVGMANGEVVTLYELNKRMQPLMRRFQGRTLTEEDQAQVEQMRRQVLRSMLDTILIRQEAERLGIAVSQAEVDNQLRRFKQERGMAEDEFREQLRIQGYTQEEFEEELRTDLLRKRLIGGMVTNKVVVTEDEIQEYYQAHQDDFLVDRSVDVSLILLDQDQSDMAQELYWDLRNGEIDFDQAAARYTKGPGAQQGGRLGVLRWKELGPEWREALEGLEPGEVSRPFSLQGMTAIVRLNDVQPGQTLPLEEVRDDIYQRIYAPKAEKQLEAYLERLRSKAVVDIKL